MQISFDYDSPYYDMKSIREFVEKNNINNTFIVGIMNAGKTYGFKEEIALHYFLKEGKTTIWLMNGWPLLNKEMMGFALNNAKNNPIWDRFTVKPTKDGYSLGFLDGKLMIIFMSVSSPTKGGRGIFADVGHIIYDEANVLDSRLYKQQVDKYNILLSRVYDNGVKVWLGCNALTMNVPLFYDYGIWDVKDEFTIFENGERRVLFHLFKSTKKALDKKYKGNWITDHFKSNGFYSHAFDNEFVLDDLNNIDENFLEKHIGYFKYTLQIEDLFIDVYKSNVETKIGNIIYMKVSQNRNVKYAIHRDYVKTGVKYRPDFAESLGMYFQTDRIWYQNVTIKQKLYNVIKHKLMLM